MINKDDFTGGDHSFKKFFQIMWQNFYIQLFLIFAILTGVLLIKKMAMGYPDIGWFFCFYLCAGASVIMVVEMIRFWDNLKNGKSN